MKQTVNTASWRCRWALLLAAAMLCTGMLPIAPRGFDSATVGPPPCAAESLDLFPHKARIRHARRFSLEYHGTYKRLEVFSPWPGAKESFVYLLVARGHTAPPDVPRGAAVIEIPVERMAAYSIIWLAFFPMLDIEQTLIGLSGCDWASTPEVVSLIREGRIAEIGDGGRGMNRQINMELLTMLKPEAVMVYATGIPEFDMGPKLLEAGFKPVVNACHMEATPLGRSEWIKFIAAFYNKEAEAERIFDDISRRYEKLAQRTRNVSRRPTVFCGVAWRGTWYTPGGESYTARFLADAGADYLWREDTNSGSMPLAIETVVDRARASEYWLDTGMNHSLSELLAVDERYGLFSAFRAGKVFNNDARTTPEGGNDFWELGIARPDLVLADLISIFHPELMADHQRMWYRQLPPEAEKKQ